MLDNSGMTTLIFLFWLTGLAAPIPQRQVAPEGAPAVVSVSGTTFPADSAEPLAFAAVTLVPLDTLPVEASPVTYQITSDAQGRFAFPAVAPGRYGVSAEREGYLRQEQFQSAPGQPGQSILTITSGQRVDGMFLRLASAPTISGIVYGADGLRLAGANVSAYRIQYTPYGRRLDRIATVLSHEGGEYRLFHLTPGFYYVTASYSAGAIRAWKSELEITPNLSNPDDGYSTVYFPGELNTAHAKTINLNSGTVENVDITFKDTRFFNLKVKLVLPPPTPLGRSLINPKVALFPAGTDLEKAHDYVLKGSGPVYQVDRLAEGEYVIVALADFLDETGKTYSGAVSETTAVNLTENTETTIAAMQPFDIFGSIFRAVNTALPNRMQVQLVRVDPLANQTFVANVELDGKFRLRNVGPGVFDVFLRGMPRNAYLQAARFPTATGSFLQIRIDADLPTRTWIDDANRLIHAWVSDAELAITYSPGGSTVNGHVTDGLGQKVPGSQIVLVPTDPAARTRKDRYGVAYSDASGAFQLQGIPPGSYTAYAFEKLEPDIYFDAEFNGQITGMGTPLTISTGFNRPVDRTLTVITKDELARHTR
jgi:hypothetical protein